MIDEMGGIQDLPQVAGGNGPGIDNKYIANFMSTKKDVN